jgi:tetraacyldisaccharide 4'-kinase
MLFKTPKFWQTNSILSYILTPLSWIYIIIHKTNIALQTPKKFNKKIICIGNITVGGSGKTPSAITLCKLLKKMGLNSVFASKNYVGRNTEAKLIDLTKDKAYEVSDEPLLLAKTALSFTAKDRIEAISFACANSNEDIIIVDDGLQNNRFSADIKILVIDSQIQFGNKKYLPAGPLRESINNINKLDFIFQIGGNKSNIKELSNFKEKIFILTPMYEMIKIPKKKYIAFSGIAYPHKFFNALKQLKINVIREISFPDHYQYRDQDLKKLEVIAKENAAHLITTEKDYIRIPNQKNIHTLIMTLKFDKEQDFIKILKKKLNTK